MYASKEQIKKVIKAGVPLLLEGPTGTGKTYMLQEIANELDADLYVVDVSGELTVDTLLGQNTLIDGNVSFSAGVLAQAITNSHKRKTIFMGNELNTALPEVLTILNGVLDDQKAVTLPDAGNTRLVASDNFFFVATQNPSSGSYAGTGRLNDALLNRMIRMEVGYMNYQEEAQALSKHTKLSDSTIAQLVRLADFTRNKMDTPLSTRDLVKILRLKENGGMALRDAIKTVVLSRFSDDDYRKLYEYHSNIMQELREMDMEDKDPFEEIKKQFADIKEQERELAKQKADLRTAVRSEILSDLIAQRKDS